MNINKEGSTENMVSASELFNSGKKFTKYEMAEHLNTSDANVKYAMRRLIDEHLAYSEKIGSDYYYRKRDSMSGLMTMPIVSEIPPKPYNLSHLNPWVVWEGMYSQGY